MSGSVGARSRARCSPRQPFHWFQCSSTTTTLLKTSCSPLRSAITFSLSSRLRNDAQVISIFMMLCRFARVSWAGCPGYVSLKGTFSGCREGHSHIYVHLAGLYKLPLKVDFFISHFLLHKMFITVVFLPVLLSHYSFHWYNEKSSFLSLHPTQSLLS